MGNSISYENKHVLITGGSEGIGYELAAQFLAAGSSVTLLSRSASKLDKAKTELLVRACSHF